MPNPVKPMNICILGTNRELYSHKRMIEAGEARGHNMKFIVISNCYMNITADKPEVRYRGGEVLQDIDAIIPRIRPSMTFYGAAVVRQFETMGVYCISSSVAINRSRDKLRCLQFLARNGIDMPQTGFANSSQDTKDLIDMVGGAPVVIKLLEGTQGRGVVLAESNKAAESVTNAFKSLKANILIQKFVSEAEGKDLRLFVVGDKVVATMQREAAEGEFRANVHLGGTVSKITPTDAEVDMAIKSSKILGLGVSGVDIIRSESGPKVLEVNSSPGLEGIEKASETDVADMIIQHIEKKVELRRQELSVDHFENM